MGEKGNLAADPGSALDAIPLDVLKSSPETLNAWFDTYLKAREVQELHRVADAGEAVTGAADAEAGGQGAGDSPA